MSTGTASRSGPRTAIAVVLLLIAAAVVAVMSAAAWGLAQEFGSFDMLVFGAIPWAALPAGLIASGVALLRGPDRGRRATWLVFAVVWAAVVVLVSALALASNALHTDDAAHSAGGGPGWTEVVTEIPGG